MKKRLSALLFVGTVLLSSSLLQAEVRKSDLRRGAPTTQELAFLSQVDLLSLYFSTAQVAHVPRFTGKKVEISSTVLDKALLADKTVLKTYFLRQIKSFVTEFRNRLFIYAPAIAKRFRATTDLAFIVKGEHSQVIATWVGGEWHWNEQVSSAKSLSQGCNCVAGGN